MAVTFKITVEGSEDLARGFAAASDMMQEALQQALQQSAHTTQRSMQDKAPVASGDLRKSITIDFSNLGALKVEIGPDEKYGLYQEKRDSLSQRTPPIDKIKEWAMTVGISGKNENAVAFLIARRIANVGYISRPFVEPTVPVAEQILSTTVSQAVDQVLRTI